MTEIEFGVNNCFAVKRWPKAADWAEIVASDLDLDVVQFSFDLLDPRAKPHLRDQLVQEIREACVHAGIKIHSTFTGLGIYSFNLLMDPRGSARLDAIDLYENMIDVSASLGATATGGHIAAMSLNEYQNEKTREERYSQLIASLRTLAARAAKTGQSLLWEMTPIARESPPTITEAQQLLEKANQQCEGRIGLCIDTGHQCVWQLLREPRENKRDLDVYSWLRKLGSITPVIHLQQTDGKADRHWPFTPEYNKRGVIHPRKIVEAIEESGAKKAFLALEVIHSFEESENVVLKDLKKSVQYVRDHI